MCVSHPGSFYSKEQKSSDSSPTKIGVQGKWDRNLHAVTYFPGSFKSSCLTSPGAAQNFWISNLYKTIDAELIHLTLGFANCYWRAWETRNKINWWRTRQLKIHLCPRYNCKKFSRPPSAPARMGRARRQGGKSLRFDSIYFGSTYHFDAFELDLVEEILPQTSVEKYEDETIWAGVTGSQPRLIQSWSRGANSVHHSDVH